MRALILLPLLAVAGLAGPAQAAERGFTVGGFDRLRASGPFTVNVRVGGPVSVRAVGTQRALDRLEVVSDAGLLRVATVKGAGGWGDWSSELGKVVVTVTVPALRGVTLTGSGDVTVDRARAAAFDATLAGSGDLSLGTIQAERMSLAVNGSGDLTAGGTTRALTVSLNGSGDIAADGLKAETAEVQVAGSGDVAVSARKTARVSLVGSGDITVSGGARCEVSKRGSGDVSCG